AGQQAGIDGSGLAEHLCRARQSHRPYFGVASHAARWTRRKSFHHQYPRTRLLLRRLDRGVGTRELSAPSRLAAEPGNRRCWKPRLPPTPYGLRSDRWGGHSKKAILGAERE